MRRRSSREISVRSHGRRERKQVLQKADLPGENSFRVRDDPALAGKSRNPNRPVSPRGELGAERGVAVTAGRPPPHHPEGKGLKERPLGA